MRYHVLLEGLRPAERHRWKILYLDRLFSFFLFFFKPAHLLWMDFEPNKAEEMRSQHFTHELNIKVMFGLQIIACKCVIATHVVYFLANNKPSVLSFIKYRRLYVACCVMSNLAIELFLLFIFYKLKITCHKREIVIRHGDFLFIARTSLDWLTHGEIIMHPQQLLAILF